MKKLARILCLIAVAVFLGGCGSDEIDDGTVYFNNSLNAVGDTETELEVEEQEMYLIVGINSAQQTMRVYRYANGLEYQYYYGMNTEFVNKYGDHISVGNFELGEVINIEGTDDEGKVAKVSKVGDVWIYDDITRFKIDEASGVLTIAEDNYRLSEDTYVFSGDEIAKLSDISNEDKLSVVGIDKDILSVSVTTGHGYLQLENTTLFEGSFLQLNTNIFAEITPDMKMEVPEGSYTLAVGNNGWGGTKKITIKRGETTWVDLDEIKGDGPKMAKILFKTDVEDARIYIDGEQIDYSNIVEIAYGAHKMAVYADGYDSWMRTLYVNSEEATIEITLGDDEEENTDTSSGTNNNSNSSSNNNSNNNNNNNNNNSGNNSSTNSNSNSSSNGGTNSTNSSTNSNTNSLRDEITNKDLMDYLSTISGLLTSR